MGKWAVGLWLCLRPPSWGLSCLSWGLTPVSWSGVRRASFRHLWGQSRHLIGDISLQDQDSRPYTCAYMSACEDSLTESPAAQEWVPLSPASSPPGLCTPGGLGHEYLSPAFSWAAGDGSWANPLLLSAGGVLGTFLGGWGEFPWPLTIVFGEFTL